MAKRLEADQLNNYFSIGELCQTNWEGYPSYTGIIGQERAEKAMWFGLNVKKKGYNIYAMGAPGTGKTTFAKSFAEKVAQGEPVPPDLCYIYNFKNPKTPKVLKLDTGKGKMLQEDMADFINCLTNDLQKVFSSKDYDDKKSEIAKKYQEQRDQILRTMSELAKEQNFGVKTTNSGIYFMPIVNGEIISEEQYDQLSQDEKDVIAETSDTIQTKAAEAMRNLREFERNTRKEMDELEYSLGLFEVGRHINPLLEKYAQNEDVIQFMLDAKEDILDNVEDFLDDGGEDEEALQALLPWYSKRSAEDNLSKYKVNILTDNSHLDGAPVIVDFNPTYANLIGEVEYDNEYGSLTTDFMKIKPGLLHKANGGYLILQAHDLLTNVHGWEALRSVLKTGEILIEPLREYTTGLAVSGIKPEPIQVNVKVILSGPAYYYEMLSYYDDEFKKLFKLCAEFDYEMPTTERNVKELIGFIKEYSQTENLKKCSLAAVERLLRYASRIAERRDKLTTQLGQIGDILTEASVWADMGGEEEISEDLVKKAIEEREYRLNMYEEKLGEMIDKDIVRILTSGKRIGQINGLAVIDTGDFAFAKPTMITATSYVGKAGIVNIEKEAEMSGSIHDKGVQVLIGYLGNTYAQDFPLSLSCRVCFEQNYSGIDGDSASSTELFAILSSLAEVPISQEMAVTGSMNQYGEIQPIGGVTYKVEGFFDVCKKRGLTGSQGVIIPEQNVIDLVLKDEVVEAIRNNLFHVYPVSHVDEAIEILMGIPAGKKNDKGKFPMQTIHGKVLKKLKEFYKKSLAEG